MKKTFTLIELILVVAIVAVLAGFMVPVISGAIEDAKIAKILQLAETLKFASQEFHSDTGRYGNDQELSSNMPAVPGWDGPYCRPLVDEDSPYRPGRFRILIPQVIVEDRVIHGVGLPDGFDLDGDGAIDRNGPGNVLIIWPIPVTAAKKINDAYDAGIPGNWETTGRVELNFSVVQILLIGGT